MSSEKQIIITGAAGFIGSALVAALNEKGYSNLILVDDFSQTEKLPNLYNKKYQRKIHREQLTDWLEKNKPEIHCIFHLGARTDTISTDKSIFRKLNIEYTQELFTWCTEHDVPFYYASSAATYGNGEQGYSDNIFDSLKPLNEYAKSKHVVDLWILSQKERPTYWAGFKFFNVYGPNEYHKGRMASVVWHAYKQILSGGYITLFRSHHPDFEDGGQKRDFVYVKDVTSVLIHFMEQRPESGIYNLGTGKAATFLELAHAVIDSINHPVPIRFIDTPENIRANYQYFTQADISKLRAAGYTLPFKTIQEGVQDYVQNYLETSAYW